jgi:transketolase
VTATINVDLRLQILDMICRSGEGHIPSSFSIVDIIEYVYTNELRISPGQVDSVERDYFILSKGHGAAALYVVLAKHGFLEKHDLESYGELKSPLGGHPDTEKVGAVEASSGSLGHGMPIGVGISLGLKIQRLENRVICLVGDGECQEGTIWEAANIAANQELGNLVVIVDWNGSAQQLLPIENLSAKWKAFGWNVISANGHSNESLSVAFKEVNEVSSRGVPSVIIAETTKGKGSGLIEGHGIWHHRIPNVDERIQIEADLNE